MSGFTQALLAEPDDQDLDALADLLASRLAARQGTADGWLRGKAGPSGIVSASSPRRWRRPIAVADWQPRAPKSGAGATRGRAFSSHLLGEETARQGAAPEPAL